MQTLLYVQIKFQFITHSPSLIVRRLVVRTQKRLLQWLCFFFENVYNQTNLVLFFILQFIHKSNLHMPMVATHRCIQFITCTMDLNTVHTITKYKPVKRLNLTTTDHHQQQQQQQLKNYGVQTNSKRTTNIT